MLRFSRVNFIFLIETQKQIAGADDDGNQHDGKSDFEKL